MRQRWKLAGLREAVIALSASFLLTATAQAACPVTYNFYNGTVANGEHVTQNFTDLTGCVAPLTNPNFAGSVTLTQNQDWQSAIQVINAHSGGNAQAGFYAFNGTSQGSLRHEGTGVNYGIYQANRTMLLGNGANGIAVNTDGANPILFGINNAEVGRFDTGGRLRLGSGSHVVFGDERVSVESQTSPSLGLRNHLSTSPVMGVWNTDTSGDNIFVNFYTENSVTNRGGISYNRAAGTVTYATTSDARLKTVLPRQKNYRAAIQSLWVGDFDKYGDFRKIGPATRSFGILAQQADKTLGGIGVIRPAVRDGIWTASSEPFAYLALWGVKDLYKLEIRQANRIKSLEEKIRSQEEKLAALQRANDRLAADFRALQARLGSDMLAQSPPNSMMKGENR